MPLNKQEAEWVDDLVRWLLGIDDPKRGTPHHKKDALHAAMYLTDEARKVIPAGLIHQEVCKLWIFSPPTPVKRRTLKSIERTEG